MLSLFLEYLVVTFPFPVSPLLFQFSDYPSYLKREGEISKQNKIKQNQGFPSGSGVMNPPANAADMGLSPGAGRSHMPRSN